MNSETDAEGFLLGFVLIWTERAPIGRYGYLAPFHAYDSAPLVLFFDESSLASQTERIASGAVVRFQIGNSGNQARACSVQVENYDACEGLAFNDFDVHYGMPGCAKFLVQEPERPFFDALKKHFCSELLDQIKEEFEQYPNDFRSQAPYLIAQQLNSICQGQLIFDPTLFASVKLRAVTRMLLKKNPRGGELRFLNRLLLEDGICSELPDAPTLADISTRVFRGTMGDYESSDKFMVRVQSDLDNAEAVFFRHCFPNESFIPRIGAQVECRILKTQFPDPLRGAAMVAYDIWQIAQTSPPRAEISPEYLGELIRRLEEQVLTRPQQGEILTVAVNTPVSGLPGPPQKAGGRTAKSSSGLCYSINTRKLILPNGMRIDVPIKHATVLNMLMAKVPGKSSERISELKYARVAQLFEKGKSDEKIAELEEKLRTREITQSQFESGQHELKSALNKLHAQILADNHFATDRANDWKRQFQKFLKRNDLNIKSLIKARKGSYGLGDGWDAEKMVKGDGEAGRI